MTTPKEKAREIYYKILNKLLNDSELIIKEFAGANIMYAIALQSNITFEHAKQCALLCVDEIISVLKGNAIFNEGTIEYYEEVKEEITKFSKK